MNADTVTVNSSQTSAKALAVRDGRILAVGSKADVTSAAGNNTTVRNMNGATILPGFIDAHGHISFTNRNQFTANIASPPGPAALCF